MPRGRAMDRREYGIPLDQAQRRRWCRLRSDPEGGCVYRTTFDLTGLDPDTFVLTGRWATDNQGTEVLINGAPTGIVSVGSPQPYAQWTPFMITTGFVDGINTLDFEVHNDLGFGSPPACASSSSRSRSRPRSRCSVED